MRASGILMPVFSLPSPHGIGTFGKEAYRFVDFLQKAGQRYWQILPLNPTNYGDSPYQSFSSFAGNPYFIDLDLLVEEGLLTPEEIAACDFGDHPTAVDYEKLYTARLPLLKKAFGRFQPDADYEAFCQQNAWWLDDYALFMAIKSERGGCWTEWDDDIRLRDVAALKAARQTYAEEMNFHRFVQARFASQWAALKAYANAHGVQILGDIPIYVAADSADVWADPVQFLLNKRGEPALVAGVPPDAFCEDGQLWGNPLYNWKYMKQDGYGWWKRRLQYALSLYDVVRIDHFRGFEAYFAVPADAETAKDGKWHKGPGMSLFKALGKDLPIVAEDLGFLTPAVHKLLAATGFPGMKVLQFAFDSREESDYLPHNYPRNCVVYTGTHDNDTILGWEQTAPPEDVAFAKKYLRASADEGLNWTMMRAALASVSDTAILTMQDLIGLGSEGRINTPATLGGNWQWRLDGACLNDWLAGILYDNTKLYSRLPTEETN
ncbi:MAG: 4-alpha-glucanotransferase [Clostridia bacterium]|nr:4-alpha-glucanotransferase [Clostridia bacterium]